MNGGWLNKKILNVSVSPSASLPRHRRRGWWRTETPRCDTTLWHHGCVCVCVITRTTASPGRVNLTSSLRFSPPTEIPQQRKFLAFISTFPYYLIRTHSSPCRLGVWVSFTLPPPPAGVMEKTEEEEEVWRPEKLSWETGNGHLYSYILYIQLF